MNNFFLSQPNRIEKMFVENHKGVTQAQISTYILLIKGQNIWQEANNGATHTFSMVFPYSDLFPLVIFFL